MDNAGEFTSKSFDEYCASLGIEVEHPVPHVHTQNGLAESFIKRIQIIARTLLLRTKLGSLAWDHVVLHAAALIRIRPTALHTQSHYNLSLGMNWIFHICAPLDVQCRCLLHLHKGLRWALNEDWGFMLDIIHHQ